MRKILYLPMEIASRELDARLLLSVVALSRGLEVVIGQKWLIESNIRRMPSGIYLSKTMTKRDARSIGKARDQGYFTAAIDEELAGLVALPDELRWISQDAVDQTDLIFISGEGNTKAFASRFPGAKDKLRMAINPRWDLLRPAFRPLFEEEIQAIRDGYGDFILINTNLGFTNSEKGTPEDLFKEQVRLGKLDPNNTEHVAYVDAICAMEVANKSVILEIIDKLQQVYPAKKIVVRPHPSERIAPWTEALQKYSNAVIVREGSVAPWIIAAEVLIHTNCTTGVEAIALGKPAICVLPSDTPVSARYLSNRVNPITRSAQETVDLTRKIVSNPGDPTYSGQMLDTFKRAMSFREDRLGAQIIVDELLPNGKTRNGWRPTLPGVSFWKPSRKYKWHLPDKNVRGDLFPHLDREAVLRRLSKITDILGIKLTLKIDFCGSKVLLISNRRMGPVARLRRMVAGASTDFRSGMPK